MLNTWISKYCKTHFLLNVAFIEKHSDIGHLNYIIIFKVYLKWVLHENIPQLTLKSMSVAFSPNKVFKKKNENTVILSSNKSKK